MDLILAPAAKSAWFNLHDSEREWIWPALLRLMVEYWEVADDLSRVPGRPDQYYYDMGPYWARFSVELGDEAVVIILIEGSDSKPA